MSDITAIKLHLNARAKEVAEHLLPAGILDGREWCVGSIGGEPGKSLKVCVSGGKVGVWADFAAGGENGDLVDLWSLVKRMDLPEALDDIRGWLGLEKPQFERQNRKSYRRPEKPKCVAPKSDVLAYLTGERKLSARAIEAYKVGEQGRVIVFPSFVGNELAFVKYLGIDRTPEGKKKIRAEAECEPVLFGWQAVPPNAREITITEGEIDALSMFDYGLPALSVPFGGGKGAKQAWIESEFDRLLRFEIIYLALDDDEEGSVAAEEIANRLGRHRCRRVILPKKDANECLKAGIGAHVIRKCFIDAKTLDPEELRRAGSYTQEVVNLFWPTGGEEKGYLMPFGKLTGKLRFRPGEVTIWTGPSGAGKSQVLSHSCIAMGEQGARMCIASLEMAPRQQLKRMVKQAGNLDRPTEEYIHEIMRWLDERVWVCAIVGKSVVKRILEIFEYARCRYGCDVFVVDSLMRLGVGSEDYEGQERAIFEIVNWAVGNEVHVHLVAHARKAGQESNQVPETEDIKGASEIGANAFNIISIWRNRKLEDEIKRADDAISRNPNDIIASDKLKELADKPPVVMNVAKQRNGDYEGKVGLWFNQDTYQYRCADDHRNGRRYVAFYAPQNHGEAA